MADFTETDKALFLEARNRMDKNIELKNGQYFLKTNSSIEIGISNEVFEYFKGLMIGTNSTLRTALKSSSVVLVQKDKSLIFLKKIDKPTHSANLLMITPDQQMPDPGGINGFNSYWWGFELKLSYAALGDIAAGTGFASVVAAAIPEPTTATKVASIVLAGCSATAWVAQNHYPNGVVITATWPGTPIIGCVTLDVKTQ
ncbi:hypothetical protein [Pedobacter borealis]|uniref:hypothetical protein n=1 Tax=Pedobacter borealis TaxID=475254 RepID=UPI0004939C92|nr:hypothetical protein [Pedobacter borealis]